jgi:hypothetical protein
MKRGRSLSEQVENLVVPGKETEIQKSRSFKEESPMQHKLRKTFKKATLSSEKVWEGIRDKNTETSKLEALNIQEKHTRLDPSLPAKAKIPEKKITLASSKTESSVSAVPEEEDSSENSSEEAPPTTEHSPRYSSLTKRD